jgi:hypothetical protein
MREEAGWDVEKVPEWIAASLSGERPTWVAELGGEAGGNDQPRARRSLIHEVADGRA